MDSNMHVLLRSKRPGLTEPVVRRFRSAILALAGLFFASVASAASIDRAEFCVDGDQFLFDVDVSVVEATTEIILRISADNQAFLSPTERISVNFDPVSGEITRVEPQVQTGGIPPFDRWQDGSISDFTITSLGGRSWQVSGSVLPGVTPFVVGDLVSQVGLREGGTSAGLTTVIDTDVPISACEPIAPPDPIIFNIDRQSPPVLDGEISFGEWPGLRTAEGTLNVLDNQGEKILQVALQAGRSDTRIYFLINALGDSGDDSILDGGQDQFALYFDVDEDGAFTEGDKRYLLDGFSSNIFYQTYRIDPVTGQGDWTGKTRGQSARAEGFGCFLADASFLPQTLSSPLQCNQHRVFEVGIDVLEIDAEDGDFRFAVQAVSGTPFVTTSFPDPFDPSTYVRVDGRAVSLQRADEPIEPANSDMVIIQAIQNEDSTLDLVAGRRTLARVYANADSGVAACSGANDRQPGIVTLHGQVNVAPGIDADLPGSPLLRYTSALPERCGPDSLSDSVQFELPLSWTEPGVVEFEWTLRALRTSFVGLQNGPPKSIRFYDTYVPTYWLVPTNFDPAFDLRTCVGLNLDERADCNWIPSARDFVADVFPVREIDWVALPRSITIGIGKKRTEESATFKKNLSLFYANLKLAWSRGVVNNGGVAPWTLPDQLVAISNERLGTSTGTASGSSTAVRNGGSGRVSWVTRTGPSARTSANGRDNEFNIAHEIVHNLDRRSSEQATWGRHAPFQRDSSNLCIDWTGTNDLDPAFPTVDADNDGSLDTGVGSSGYRPRATGRANSPVLVPAETPDLMTYCNAPVTPTEWISAYRWRCLLLDEFRTPAGVGPVCFNPSSASAWQGSAGAGYAKPQSANNQDVSDTIYVIGQTQEVDGSGSLSSLRIGPGIPDEPSPAGPYSVAVADCDGLTLDEQFFTPSYVEEEADPDESGLAPQFTFSVQLTANPSACSVQLKQGAAILDERVATAAAPVVQVLSPNGGESLDGVASILWTASDDDGDALEYDVQISYDDGVSYYPLAAGLTTTEFEINSDGLAFSDSARILVTASDGFHTSEDLSDAAFSLAGAPPFVRILGLDQEEIPSDTMLSLSGEAFASDGSAVPSEFLEWQLNGETIGFGETVDFRTGNGEQVITLIVEPEIGPAGQVSNSFFATEIVEPTFTDVTPDYWAFEFIETLAASGITAGCGVGVYCPEDSVTRAQMAVFLVRGINGSNFQPPAATGTVFTDVAAGAFAASFIERFFQEGITAGCGGGKYCPSAPVTRAQMAVFLLRAKNGPGFVPPAATGIFADVPPGSFASDWIEALFAAGITSGCGSGNYCPGEPVSRAQMAVFLVRTFGL